MDSFKNFRKLETVKDMIDELENMKMYHNFSRKTVSNDFLEYMAGRLREVGIEPDDIYASVDQPAEKQEEYLFYKSAPGCGMGKGALGDLRKILSELQ